MDDVEWSQKRPWKRCEFQSRTEVRKSASFDSQMGLRGGAAPPTLGETPPVGSLGPKGGLLGGERVLRDVFWGVCGPKSVPKLSQNVYKRTQAVQKRVPLLSSSAQQGQLTDKLWVP